MPRTTTDPKINKLEMRVSDAFLKLVDSWRKKQADKPSRSEAIRQIVLEKLGD